MRIGLKPLSVFLRQFATLMDSGIPVVQSLETLERTAQSIILRRAVGRVRTRIQEGEHLHKAIEEEENAFPVLVVRMMEVGEASGTLEQVLSSLADYYEWQLMLRRRVMVSFILPVIEFVVAILVVTLVIYLTTMLTGGLDAVEKARSFLLFWVFLIVGIFVFYFFMTRVVATKKFFDHVILHIPIFGRIARRLCIARLTFAMQMMVRAAIPFPEMFLKAAQATGNQAFVSRFRRAAAAVSEGVTLTEALSQTRLLDRGFLEVVEVAEESGKLEESLERLASQRGQDAQRAVQYLATAVAWLVYIMVSLIIIYYIFTLALKFWFGPMQDLMSMERV